VTPQLRARPTTKYLVPEVVQTSMMDCGPAALQSLVAGFGLAVNYGRLREACQTGVDGTSISTMDEIAKLLGLDTEEMMLPVDHLLVEEAHALPAIVVIKNPGGANHFVVVWSVAGPWIQVMDPAEGRHWIRRSQLFDQLYIHYADVPAETWRRWAGEPEFQATLAVRLAALEIAPADRARLAAAALADPGWRSLSALDAATRMTAAMVDGGAVAPGAACLAFIEQLIAPDEHGGYPLILGEYRSAWRLLTLAPDEDDALKVRGAVIVRARGRHGEHRGGPAVEPTRAPPDASILPPELAAALTEQAARPGRTLLGMLLADGLLTPVVLTLVLAMSAAMVTVDALLLRGLLELGSGLGLASQRAVAIAGILGFLALGLLVELPLLAGALRLGRALDLRLRMAFLDKLPRLDDRYFRSRLLSDMAERGHSLHVVRALPVLGVRVLSATAQLVLTVGGIAWLAPASAPLALLAAAISIGLPILCQPLMTERELRMRSHGGALGRFYLDALLGLLPIRVHGARQAMQHQQAALLAQWEHAGLRYHAASTMVEGVIAVTGLGLAVIMVWSVAGHATSGLLLLVYWALNLPALGQQLAIVARQYPVMRNIVARLLEPLGTPDPIVPASTLTGPPPVSAFHGVAIRMAQVSVEAAGTTVLDEVDLAIAPGEHVAIVGASGAGKSSLVGLLLGWYRPATGTVDVDGRPLVGDWLSQLRRDTAWVDPSVTLWNRSFLDNLRYGTDDTVELPLSDILVKARLREVLEHLPDGLATELGEGGGMVSGGEGQRTRVGRALARRRARLVVLDEPFRGLDLTTRRELLATVRAWWAESTILWITHDIAETVQLARVIVIDAGRIVEDGDPRELARRPGSAYAALLEADRAIRAGQWSAAHWRRIWLAGGTIQEDDEGS
jgi:ABC-type bacteriocin/lantibiotic exporter with double-glycine peptidase domain